LQRRFNLSVKLRLAAWTAARSRPLLDWFVENVDIALVRRHRIRGYVAGADACERACDLRKVAQESILKFNVPAQGLLQTRADRFIDHRRDRSFIKLGYKFGTEASEQPERAGEYRDGSNHHEPARRERDTQERFVNVFGSANDHVVAFADATAQQKRAK